MKPLSLVALVFASGPLLANGSSSSSTFDAGVDAAGWTYGPAPTYPTNNGNPGDHLRTLVDTFAPQVRTTGASVFTGDYRANNVTSIGADFRTFATNFPALREATLMLANGSCQVYFLGTETIPQPNEGWKSVDFDIPSQSTTMPPGWTTFGSCPDPDTAWNNVITDVTEVRFFYGDPTLFYIFDQWTCGFDNARIACGNWPWYELGESLAGTNGAPILVADGPLLGNDFLTISLTNTPPLASTFLVAGTTAINLPTLDGILVPNPGTGFLAPLFTDANGEFEFTTLWPPGFPTGLQLYLQYWVVDGGASMGLSASNAVVGTNP